MNNFSLATSAQFLLASKRLVPVVDHEMIILPIVYGSFFSVLLIIGLLSISSEFASNGCEKLSCKQLII